MKDSDVTKYMEKRYVVRFSPNVNEAKWNRSGKRVVSVTPPKEFIGNDENYLVIRKYETHAETWAILQIKGDPHNLIKDNEISFEARDGQWYCLWHDYHHTNEQAGDCLEQYADMLGEIQEGHWEVTL